MDSRALIIFVKTPVAGKVKTRVAQTAGSEKALRIYQELLRHTHAVCLRVSAHRYVYCDSAIPRQPDLWFSPDFAKRLQQGNDLGSRMAHALGEVLALHEKALLIGSDIPGLQPHHLDRAFHWLDQRDVVLGPALDGGYYLIGMRQLHTTLFTDIEWSTPLVLQRTVERIEQLGLTHALIEPLADVDYEQDWDRYGWPID